MSKGKELATTEPLDLVETVYEDKMGQEIKLTIKMVQQYMFPDAKACDAEALMFIRFCQYQQLNPFDGDVFLIRYQQGTPARPVVGKWTHIKRAQKHKAFDGLESGVIYQDENGKVQEREGAVVYGEEVLVGGWARAYRKDRTHNGIKRVLLEEYDKKRSTWNALPITMIVKVAENSALRMAFPEDLAAMYDEVELAVMDSKAADDAIAANMPGRLSDATTSGEDGVGEDEKGAPEGDGGGGVETAPDGGGPPAPKKPRPRKKATPNKTEPPVEPSPGKEDIVSTDHEVVEEVVEKNGKENDDLTAQEYSDEIHSSVKDLDNGLSTVDRMNFMGSVVTSSGNVEKLKEVYDVLRKRLDG